MTKKPDPKEILAEMNSEIEKVRKKTEHLEAVSKEAGAGQVFRDKRWNDLIASLKSNMSALKDDIKETEEKIRQYEKTISLLAKDFKIIVTKDDLEKVESRINSWPLEFFVQNDLERKDLDR